MLILEKIYRALCEFMMRVASNLDLLNEPDSWKSMSKELFVAESVGSLLTIFLEIVSK